MRDERILQLVEDEQDAVTRLERFYRAFPDDWSNERWIARIMGELGCAAGELHAEATVLEGDGTERAERHLVHVAAMCRVLHDRLKRGCA